MTLRVRSTLIALVYVVALVSLSAAQKPIAIGIQADGLSTSEREPLRAYLARQMGREVKLVILNNYNEYLAGLGDGSTGSRDVMAAVEQTCSPVSGVSGLYDCMGHADALAASAT